jgi:hypothetical protein
VAASGPLGCAGACTAIIDPLLVALLGPEPTAAGPAAGAYGAPVQPLDPAGATLGGGLAVLHAVLSAVASAPPEARAGDLGAPHPLQQRAPRVAALLSLLDRRVDAAGEAGADGVAGGGEAAQARVWALRLRLQLLLLEAGGSLRLPATQLRESLARLVQHALRLPGGGGDTGPTAVTDGSSDDEPTVELWLDWDRRVAPSAEAMAALEKLASAESGSAAAADGSVAAAVSACVEAQLLPALRSPAAARALSVLQLLAGGEHGGAWQLLAWLQPLVVEGLAAWEQGAPDQQVMS